MNEHAFQHDVRILVCPSCGAPLRIAPAGGVTVCQYCQATATFQPRTEHAEILALQARGPSDEYDRFQKLREQEGKRILPAPGLEHLVVGGSIPGGLVPEAQAEWQKVLAEVKQGGNFASQERLFYLTWALSDVGGADEYWQRAYVESAVEVLEAPQHKSQLRCILARQAARVGDFASADAWLAACDPASLHLEVDSQYRFSQAHLAAYRGDYRSALRWLGERPGEIPMHDSIRRIAALFRSDALEKLGRLEEARTALEGSFGPGDPHDFIAQVQACHPKLTLCPQSLAALQARTATAQEAADSSSALTGIGCLVSTPFFLLGTGFFVWGFFVDPSAETDDGQMMLNHLLWLMGGSFLLCALAVPFFMWRSAKSSAARARWEKARATVVSASPTGLTVNGLPQFRVQARVFRGNDPPYETSFSLRVPHHQVAEMKPGLSLSVRVDPSDPRHVEA